MFSKKALNRSIGLTCGRCRIRVCALCGENLERDNGHYARVGTRCYGKQYADPAKA